MKRCLVIILILNFFVLGHTHHHACQHVSSYLHTESYLIIIYFNGKRENEQIFSCQLRSRTLILRNSILRINSL